MNVVITLPEHLIKAIMMGEKFFEIRSKKPLHFDRTKDVVFVVQKGTRLVPIYFTVFGWYTYRCRINSLTGKYIAIMAAVSVEYINNYSEEKDCIYAWVIGCACTVDCPGDLYSNLKIDKNPQSYIYRDYEWRQIAFNSYKWLTKPAYFSQKLEPTLEYVKYMRSLSSAKPSTL